jgi:hypothetical protein
MKLTKQLNQYHVVGYTDSLFCHDNGRPIRKGRPICSTWNHAKALKVYAEQSQSAEFDCVKLWHAMDLRASTDPRDIPVYPE